MLPRKLVAFSVVPWPVLLGAGPRFSWHFLMVDVQGSCDVLDLWVDSYGSSASAFLSLLIAQPLDRDD